MAAEAFIDTNILRYAASTSVDEAVKRAKARNVRVFALEVRWCSENNTMN